MTEKKEKKGEAAETQHPHPSGAIEQEPSTKLSSDVSASFVSEEAETAEKRPPRRMGRLPRESSGQKEYRPPARPLPLKEEEEKEEDPQLSKRWGEWPPQERRPLVDAEEPEMPPHIRRFFRRLHQATPRTFVTETIVVINLVVFGVMLVRGAHIFTPNAEFLVQWGANFGPLTLSGDWWRLLTATFLHGGLFHLLINMWVLWDLRDVVERLTGSVGFFLLYFFSGIMGSLASVFWNPNIPSVGASGAIFGVFGGLLSFVWVHRESIPREILRNLRSSAIMVFVLNLFMGVSVPNIDIAGHIGGLLAGLGAGSILSQPVTLQMQKSRLIRNLLLLVVSVAVISVSWFFLPKGAGAWVRFVRVNSKVESALLQRYRDASKSFQAGKIQPKQFAELLDKEILAPWNKMIENGEKLSRRDMSFSREKELEKILQVLRWRATSWKAFRAFLLTGKKEFLLESVRAKRRAEGVKDDDPRSAHPELFRSSATPSRSRAVQRRPSSRPSLVQPLRVTSQPSVTPPLDEMNSSTHPIKHLLRPSKPIPSTLPSSASRPSTRRP